MNSSNGVEDRLPPDVMGHMAGLDGHENYLGVCNSCVRAVNYSLLQQIAANQASVQTAMTRLEQLAPRIPFGSRAVDEIMSQLRISLELGSQSIHQLLEMTGLDMEGVIPLDYWDTNEEWQLALQSFYKIRVEQYVDPENARPIFLHDESEGTEDE